MKTADNSLAVIQASTLSLSALQVADSEGRLFNVGNITKAIAQAVEYSQWAHVKPTATQKYFDQRRQLYWADLASRLRRAWLEIPYAPKHIAIADNI